MKSMDLFLIKQSGSHHALFNKLSQSASPKFSHYHLPDSKIMLISTRNSENVDSDHLNNSRSRVMKVWFGCNRYLFFWGFFLPIYDHHLLFSLQNVTYSPWTQRRPKKCSYFSFFLKSWAMEGWLCWVKTTLASPRGKNQAATITELSSPKLLATLTRNRPRKHTRARACSCFPSTVGPVWERLCQHERLELCWCCDYRGCIRLRMSHLVYTCTRIHTLSGTQTRRTHSNLDKDHHSLPLSSSLSPLTMLTARQDLSSPRHPFKHLYINVLIPTRCWGIKTALRNGQMNWNHI